MRRSKGPSNDDGNGDGSGDGDAGVPGVRVQWIRGVPVLRGPRDIFMDKFVPMMDLLMHAHDVALHGRMRVSSSVHHNGSGYNFSYDASGDYLVLCARCGVHVLGVLFDQPAHH